ncbi:MFS transporter [Antrihabitans sp. YC2-6]|nr:MFS transporter [Antrihabitans sp. YC2-6]
MLDGTVVNIALPRIGEALDADVAGLQWTLSGYTLTLASFILLGGALGDRLGRRKVFVWGTIGFAIASMLCGLAWNIEVLVAARILQGIAGALLTPGSLALISASIDREDRGAAIGIWSGLGGVAGAIGPLLGGALVEVAGWRSVFFLNLPLCVAVVLVAIRHVPESKDPNPPGKLDMLGALVVALGLGALTYGLIDAAIAYSALGLVLLIGFVVIELRSDHPLVPPRLFASRIFLAANLVTFAVYAALGGVFFLLLLQLQLVAGYTPLASGVATIPITLLMLALSARAGRWGQRVGPRMPMTIGPVVAAVGLLLMLRIDTDASYWLDVLPGIVVFGLGLSILVAPLTGAVLGSVPTAEAGIASGVNNAVARTSQLLAVAALPGLAGLTGSAFGDTDQFAHGFRVAMMICVGLLLLGGALAATMIKKPTREEVPDCVDCKPHCGINGPAIQPRSTLTEGVR